MARHCLALIPLLASVALHAALVLVLARSANGAESDFSLRAPRLVGNTFEIETLDEASRELPESAPAQPRAPVAPPERVTATPAAAPAETVPTPRAPEPASETPVPSEPEAPSTVDDTADDNAAEPEPQAAPPAAHADEAPNAAEPEAKAASRASSPETNNSGAVPAGSATDVPSTPTYGQGSLPPHVGSLAKAFTRAVPRAAFRDPAWHRLPMGGAGKVIFRLELDEMGKVVGAASVEPTEPAPPSFLKSLVARTVLMLKAGTFALTERIQAGTQRFELSAELRRVEPLDDALADPNDLRQIGRLVEPTRVRPGKANFTYNSGRQVELTIRMLAE